MHASQPSIMVDPGDTATKVRTIPSRVIPSQLDTYLTLGNGHGDLCLSGDAATLLVMFRAAADMLDAHHLPCGCRVGALDGDTHPATCGDTAAVAAAGIAEARAELAASHEFRITHLYECAACTEKWERNRDTDLAAVEADDEAEAVA